MKNEKYFISNYYLLTRTFLFVIKRLHRKAITRYGSRLQGLVLDLGCGNQPYKSLLAHDAYVPVDIDIDRRPMVVADAQWLPFRDESVDSVLCTEVIEHVREPSRVIAEIWRVLKPDGILLLTAPMSWGLHYEPHDYWRFTPYGLKVLLEQQGFIVEEIQRIGGLFSLIGARLVEGIALAGWKWLKFLPCRIRHAFLLLFSIPTSLLFVAIGDLFDHWFETDAIGHAVIAQKCDVESRLTSSKIK